ncbi:MAG: KilA-N domain-containing protein [Flavobacterium sp.]|nr:MAG: KilA-N domain-containing protein [Flavobacterium sp.]
MKNNTIDVQCLQISITIIDNSDYISLTDIARNKNPNEPKDVVKNWMRSRNVIEFLGLWEQINNQKFKGVEFDSLLFEAGSNSFTLSPTKWIEKTNAIGIISKLGNKVGTYAHKDIAFEFASWISAGFKLFLIKEFQRLKDDEGNRLNLQWSFQRTLAKVNYHIHTDAIKLNLIPKGITAEQRSFIYSNEADLLNVALFEKTAKQWREENPNKKGNIRDEATIEQLVVLSNLESINAMLIDQKLIQADRLDKLNQLAITQMKSLIDNKSIQKLK